MIFERFSLTRTRVSPQTSELYDMLSHDGLHNRIFLEKIFESPDDPENRKLEKLHDLYRKALALYLYVCPREYGMTPEEKVRAAGVSIVLHFLTHPFRCSSRNKLEC